MEVNNVDEEDEDVVIQGSALHEHLSKLGYTDFESTPMPKRTYQEEKYLNIDIKNNIQKIYTKLVSFYSWIIQEKNISKKQLNVILNSEVLLSDHFSVINDFVSKYNNNSKKITLQQLIATGTVLISSTYIIVCKHKILPILFTSSIICCASYIKYLRFSTNRNLKNIISLQNELFAMCKEGLKILRRDYKIKLGFETCLQQFSQFLGKKLQYLQSLTEILVKFMENISCVYYQCSLSITKLIPPGVLKEESFTKFEYNSFGVSDEIDYQALKKLYHTYLLVQSEMLHLLAIAYDSNTWIHCCQMIPESKLAHIIHSLTKKLVVHKKKLSEIINAYYTCKAEPVRDKVRDRAKWHDPTIQLDLASYKLQLAYNQVFSVFKDIDDCINQETVVDNEIAEVLMQNLNKAFKEINTAKSLAEFVILLMAKSGFNNLRDNQPITDDIMTNLNHNLPMIIDSTPEILDEVFEEYIKEEYLKPLQEETDEYLLEQQKLDKLLVKNFMTELKEALVDKHKSMSERESKALQRIYKNISRDSLNTEDNINQNFQFIPAPPPMPSYYIWSTCSNNIESNSSCKKMISATCNVKNGNSPILEKIDDSDEEIDSIKVLKYKNTFNILSTELCKNKNEETLTSLPQILLETQATQFVMKLPPAFLQEETFIGSGENSENEMANNTSDNDENSE